MLLLQKARQVPQLLEKTTYFVKLENTKRRNQQVKQQLLLPKLESLLRLKEMEHLILSRQP